MSSLLLHHEWYDLPCCTDMRCSLFIFYFLTTFIWFSIISFLLFIYPIFCPILTLIHFSDLTPFFMIHWWLDHFSSFLISPSTFPWTPLKFHGLRDFFYALHYMQGYGFDHWVFEPSFSSFLSPYHPGLRYVQRLKTTLRPWDQTLSLTVFTWWAFVDWLK